MGQNSLYLITEPPCKYIYNMPYFKYIRSNKWLATRFWFFSSPVSGSFFISQHQNWSLRYQGVENFRSLLEFFFILIPSLDINKGFSIGNLRLCLSFHSQDFLGEGQQIYYAGTGAFSFHNSLERFKCAATTHYSHFNFTIF